MQPKTFLFDIGNVLIHVNFDHFLNLIGKTPAENSELFLGEIKNQFETGKIPPEEFIASGRDLLNFDGADSDFIQAWNGHMTENAPMWELVEKLAAQNHRLILFSNTNSIHAEYFLNQYPGFRHFTHHHFSHEVGSLKPADPFYETAIRSYELIPEETIYIDDLPENIETGINHGFQCWQYDSSDHEAFLNWLARS